MHNILRAIGDLGIVPVVTMDDAAQAVPVCKALADGGLPVAEITFRTAAAEEAIRLVSAELPGVLVGAGTVLTTDQAMRATKAGAQFIVSPGFGPEVVHFCVDRGVPVTPGCSNPTDLGLAAGFGLEVVKFFPAEMLGGLAMLKAISAPYPSLKFIPTGGIDASNLSDYLAFSKVVAIGGSWMVKPELVKAGDLAEITRLTREAVAAMLGFELAHIGINTADAEESMAIAGRLGEIFDMPTMEGEKSNWTGTGFEIMKGRGRGTHGHIAVRTNSLPRAIAYMKRRGIEVDEDSAYPTDGPMTSIFLKDEIAGFAVHLLQKS